MNGPEYFSLEEEQDQEDEWKACEGDGCKEECLGASKCKSLKLQ